MSTRPDLDALTAGVLASDRASIARSITLVESTRADHQELAQELLVRLLPHAGKAHRVGISGVPGAGKSTFIDALGTRLTADGKKVAVLAVDPSSTRFGGSILGDKTRMQRLSVDENAYIRPSPTSGSLGGVTRSTRQAIVVVEAAGFDVVVVETVGVGQSETAVADMVDGFLLLTVARTGDSLQGIKRGVLELADVIAVNKADGDHVVLSQRTASELADALSLFEPLHRSWRPRVLTCSAREGTGVDVVWRALVEHRLTLERAGELGEKRLGQEAKWMWSMVHDQIRARLRGEARLRDLVGALEADLRAGRTTAAKAAATIVAAALAD